MSIPVGGAAPTEGILALRRALRRSVVRAAIGVTGLGAVLAVTAGLLVGWRGVWGAVIGTLLSFAFLAVTAAVGSRMAGKDPTAVASVVLGSWLVKIVAVLGVGAALQGRDFFDGRALVAGLTVGLFVTLWAEYRAVTSADIPNVEPRQGH